MPVRSAAATAGFVRRNGITAGMLRT